MIVIAGCASSKIISRQEYQGEKVARPNNIIVYDFSAIPGDAPPESAQTSEQIETGRRLGTNISTVLTDEIRNMRLPAERASSQTQPQMAIS
jgi:hypothetical protein